VPLGELQEDMRLRQSVSLISRDRKHAVDFYEQRGQYHEKAEADWFRTGLPSLSPGGYHMMLMDLKTPLKQGDKLPITLEFEKAGKVTVSFDVESVGAQGPGGASGEKMDMKKM
jgi:Copper chaperone PCu(A)C